MIAFACGSPCLPRKLQPTYPARATRGRPSHFRHPALTCCSPSPSLPPSLPPIFPVTTPTSTGVCVAIESGVVLTCEHVVHGSGAIKVAGSPAALVATCAADLALLRVPALDSLDPSLLPAFLPPAASMEPQVVVVDSKQTFVHATVDITSRVPSIFYSSSNSLLPALRLFPSDDSSAVLDRGCSGSPVLSVANGDVVGIVVHGAGEPDAADAVAGALYAVPAGLIRWFLRKRAEGLATGAAKCAGGQVFRVQMSAVPNFITEECDAELRAEVQNAARLRSGSMGRLETFDGGATVIHARADSGLREGDVVVKVGERLVGSDGCVGAFGMRLGVEAAFIDHAPGTGVSSVIFRRSPAGKGTESSSSDLFREEAVPVEVVRAEESVLNVDRSAPREVAEAGGSKGCAGGIQLAELSVDSLRSYFGEAWPRICGEDILDVVGSERTWLDEGPAGVRRVAIIVSRVDCAEDKAAVGLRVVYIGEQPVECLNDVFLGASAAEDAAARARGGKVASSVIATLSNGALFQLPLPIRRALNSDHNSNTAL